ncbi:PorP/SprF family type IX secretion system membrane protein [Penaeicola halotolerans]|uniref:PorP/SprF family type IX secretion system membrane protein n=1 Tax=Penaeicola halotolerans TaxID=2793196 RepID=UPI001CF822A3|nr:type IX secretion system membrane protein PorP/SprF [Penaeicola halotolerans]
MKKSLLLMAFIMLSLVTQAQQTPQFTQYIFNGIHINPGYAGYKGVPYFQSTYRRQWVNLPGAPRTLSVSADVSANEGTMGFGLSILADQAGPTSTTTGSLSYAYRVQVGRESFIGLGVSAGMAQYVLDGSKLNPADMDDPDIPQGRQQVIAPDMSLGIFFHNERYYAGLSAFNLIGQSTIANQNISLSFHNYHYYFTAGGLFDMGYSVKFKPSFLIREETAGPTNYDINAMFLFNERLWLGTSFRSNVKFNKENLQNALNNRNSIAILIEVFATEDFRIGYAFDYNTNALQGLNNNSHEISLGYYINPKYKRMRNPRWF